MNIKSPDNTEPKISRRQFLKEGAAVVGATIASYMGIRTAKNSFFPSAAKAQTTETSTEVSPEPKDVAEKPPQASISTEDELFKNFSDEEKAFIEKEIAIYKARYENANDKSRIDRVLDWEKSTLQPILNLDVPDSEHQFWREFISAVVYVESEGKVLAHSEVGIVGLAQISQTTASAVAKKHGILTFDLKKGWDSLRLSRFHFQDLMEKFSPDISFLGYYAGESFVDKKISAALNKRGISQINIANLDSKDGVEYLAKTTAAMRILKDARIETKV